MNSAAGRDALVFKNSYGGSVNVAKKNGGAVINKEFDVLVMAQWAT